MKAGISSNTDQYLMPMSKPHSQRCWFSLRSLRVRLGIYISADYDIASPRISIRGKIIYVLRYAIILSTFYFFTFSLFRPSVSWPLRQHAKISDSNTLICNYTLKLFMYNVEKKHTFFLRTKFELTCNILPYSPQVYNKRRGEIECKYYKKLFPANFLEYI